MSWAERFSKLTQSLILMAVVGSFVAGTAILIAALVISVYVFVNAISAAEISVKVVKAMTVDYILIVDLFLVAPVFYIISLGLYQLSTKKELPLPDWLKICSLQDLKAKLLELVVVVLAVHILGEFVRWDGKTQVWSYGLSVALVIAALAWHLSLSNKSSCD